MQSRYKITLLVASAIFFAPAFSHAATFEVSGWIPYWRTATGTADVMPNLDKLTEINPFVYTVKSDGTLVDNGSLNEEPWKSLIAEAKRKKVRVIPTVMWSDREAMHRILSDTKERIALEDRIAALVKNEGYDGIDIDFEGKKADSKEYFSLFLKGLYQRMGNKWVMCTIETRTPMDSRYYGTTPPADAGIFANDLKEINKYCDRVRVMAYDQQGVDMKLAADAEAKGELYAPVGDPAWVEKVINLMAQDIKKSKIQIGVPTYGYEYAVTAYANNQYVYDILWTFNPGYAIPLAAQYNITPERTPWGEMAFSYIPQTGATTTPPISGTRMSALAAAAAASGVATANNTNLTFRYMVWPDAQSVAQKIELAKKLGVRGVAVFKFDGGQDPAIWGVLNGVAGTNTSAGAGGGASSARFTTALTRGMTNDMVRALQVILNSDPDTRVASSGAGSPGNESRYFGAATAKAVGAFQVKWGIAAPGNPGFGNVGPKTRVKLNELAASL